MISYKSILHNKPTAFIRLFSVTRSLDLNQKLREEKGLPLNPNAYGILTDKPDYSFLDGRPTPLGSGQCNRLLKQKDIAEKIITLTKEMDYAVDRYKQRSINAMEARKAILDSKLKPKGELLNKK